MGPIRYPETSVLNYHSTLRNIPEERRSEKSHLRNAEAKNAWRFTFTPLYLLLRDINGHEICGLLGYYAASYGNCLPTFRDKVSVASSRVKSPSRTTTQRRVIPQKIVDLTYIAVEAWNSLFLEGPRSRSYRRTAALRLIVQPCDEDERKIISFFFIFTSNGAPVELNWQGKNLSHCHFVHHKSHMDWPRIEPGPPQWEIWHTCMRCSSEPFST
jgi:hypothetical protein